MNPPSDFSNSHPDVCPTCGNKGKSVKPITLRSLLRPELVEDVRGNVRGNVRGDIGEETFNFCENPECPMAYYGGQGTVFSKDDLTVRIGIKESSPPRTICYCFDHSMEEIRDEIVATGRSTMVEAISEELKDGCWCETKNPQGVCCLGAVSRFVRETKRELEAQPLTPALAAHSENFSSNITVVDEADCSSSTCCAEDAASSNGHKAGLLAAGGSALSALLASACCWLPLLLISFGISAGGLSRFFLQYRPLFLGGSVVLLGVGFYLLYFRQSKCDPSSSCSKRDIRLLRFNRSLLWVAAIGVGLFAFFPNYVGMILPSQSVLESDSISSSQRLVTLRIEKMTCEGCATVVQSALTRVPGVDQCSVSYEDSEAVCVVNSSEAPSLDMLAQAVASAGYRAFPKPESP